MHMIIVSLVAADPAVVADLTNEAVCDMIRREAAPEEALARVRAMAHQGQIDIITFHNTSTAEEALMSARRICQAICRSSPKLRDWTVDARH